jgi:hypothetical protein
MKPGHLKFCPRDQHWVNLLHSPASGLTMQASASLRGHLRHRIVGVHGPVIIVWADLLVGTRINA